MSLVGYDPKQGASRAASKAQEGWRRFWSGFTTGQKAVTIVAVLVLLLGVVVFASFSSTPNYQPLFTGLQAKDAAAITTKLNSAGVPYRLASGGSTVEVPASDVNAQRMAMAAANLPQAGTGAGLSLLSTTGITTSQLTQQADYQRAVQDELSTTIDSIRGVSGSRVAIVLPSQSAFALGNAQHPSASVMVDLSPGASLSSGQVAAISHLVASAVPDLSSSGVTVVDGNGTLLTGPGAQTGTAATLTSEQSYDVALESSITSMLDRVVGQGNAEVRVVATLSSANTNTVTHAIQVTPKTGKVLQAPTSVSNTKQTFSGTGVIPGGVLGTNTVTAAGGKSTYAKSTSTSKYETGVVDTTTTQPPGQVALLSVSAVVNGLPKGVTLASLRSAVAAAAGIVPARGDTLSVVSVPFSTAASKSALAAAHAAAAAKARAQLVGIAKDVAVVAAIAIALLVLWRKSKRKAIDVPTTLQPAVLSGPVQTAQLDAVTTTATLPAVAPDSVEDLATRPDVVSRILSAWLAEGKPQVSSK